MAGSNLIKTKILQRIDSEENWNIENPVLSSGEMVFSRTNGGVFMKIGDGRAYSDTPFNQKMVVDGEMVSSLAVVHVSMREYSAMLRDGTADSNTAYVISSDLTDMCGQQVKNVADGTNLSDAVTLGQLYGVSASVPLSVSQLENDIGYLSAVPEKYSTYEQTTGALSNDGYVTSAVLDDRMSQIQWISALSPSAFQDIEPPAASVRSIQGTLSAILEILKQNR